MESPDPVALVARQHRRWGRRMVGTEDNGRREKEDGASCGLGLGLALAAVKSKAAPVVVGQWSEAGGGWG